MTLLRLDNVHTYYGNIHALKGISITVDEGEIVTLIGANGAGKSTTLKTISGLLYPRQGKVYLEDKDLTKFSAHEIVKMGVVHVPEGRRVFSRLTVMENLEMGAFTRSDKAGIQKDLKRVFDLFPRLEERQNQVAGTLSGGEQQMLAMGRALMSSPHILLLDEPSMGLAPVLVDLIFDTIVELNKQGMTILLVEQNALLALEVAHRGYVLETGRIVLEGDAKKLKTDPQVKEAYLGGA
ncbi:MAG TPA: ABC transporter ATP-binding protein [Anaerolineae bacterium]|nr:ABC transporter ATP-binding protein [Anaerolineae bacterium]